MRLFPSYPWPSRNRLSTHIGALAVGAAVLPLGLLGALAIDRCRQVALTQTERHGREVADHVAAEIARLVDGKRDNLRGLVVQVLAVGAFDGAEATRRLRQHALAFPELGPLDLFAADGTLQATSRVMGEIGRLEPGLVDAAQRGQRFVGLARTGPDLEPGLVLAEPVRSSTGAGLVLVAHLRFTEMWDRLAAIRLGASGSVRLVDEQGVELGHGDPREQLAILRRSAASMKAGPVDRSETPRRIRTASGVEAIAVGAGVGGLGLRVITEQPIAEALHAVEQLSAAMAALVAGVALLVASVAAVVARRLARPLGQVAAHARRIGDAMEAGQAPTALAMSGPEEIQDVTRAFVTMAADLDRLYEQAKDRERLAIVAQVGAGLTHDLHTPLASVANMIEIAFCDREQAPALHIEINREIGRIQSRIGRLKELARPDGAIHAAQSFPIDLDEAAEYTAARLRRGGVVPASVELLVSRSEAGAEVLGVSDNVDRILENLLTNAFHAMADRGGRVEVAVSRDGEVVVLVVRDQGRGIAPDRIPRLFKTFSSTRGGGFGLGLVLVRVLVEEMRGTITAASAVGVGTTFTMRFPALQARAAGFSRG